jgi:hypothetical protein
VEVAADGRVQSLYLGRQASLDSAPVGELFVARDAASGLLLSQNTLGSTTAQLAWRLEPDVQANLSPELDANSDLGWVDSIGTLADAQDPVVNLEALSVASANENTWRQVA